MLKPLPLLAALIAGLGYMTSAQAFFSDDEARIAINALRKEMTAVQGRIDQIESSQKASLAIADQIEALKQSQAKFFGRLEVLENQLAQQQKNAKDIYADLDSRLRTLDARTSKLEHQKVQVPAPEKNAYDAGLAAFQAGKYAESVRQFKQLLSAAPHSAYAPEALYWQGNAFFALQSYQEAAAVEDQMIRTFSSSSRVPDAMLSLASSQTALGNMRAAYSTYESLAKRFPASEQAKIAAERMKELKATLPAKTSTKKNR